MKSEVNRLTILQRSFVISKKTNISSDCNKEEIIFAQSSSSNISPSGRSRNIGHAKTGNLYFTFTYLILVLAKICANLFI